MKKILVVFHDNNYYSGATKSMLTNILFLNKNSQYEFICFVPNKPGHVDTILKKNNIPVFKLNYCGTVYSINDRGLKLFYSKIARLIKIIYTCTFTLKKSLNILSKYKIDAVYSNTCTINLGYFISRKLKIKHFWHFREYCELDQHSKLLLKKQIFKKLNYDDNNIIIVISNSLKEYYQKQMPDANIRLVYNDVDSNYINPKNVKHDSNNQFNLLIAGTICEEKGQMYAIKLHQKLLENNFFSTLYIAGSINDYANYLKKYVKENKIPNVIFCGLVKNMNQLREKIDIGIIASKSEAFGRVVIENMLSNILVVASNTGGLPELINTYQNGILFEYGNLKDMYQKLMPVLNDKKMYNQIILNAYQYALNFTNNRAGKQIKDIFDKEI